VYGAKAPVNALVCRTGKPQKIPQANSLKGKGLLELEIS
jgi:hypothetical protein